MLEQQDEFFKQKQNILNKYELEYSRYYFKVLSGYFKSHGFDVSVEVIKKRMIYNGIEIKDEVVAGEDTMKPNLESFELTIG